MITAVQTAEGLMAFIRIWFAHRPEALAKFGDVSGKDPRLVLDMANTLFRGDPLLLRLNCRFDIGTEEMESWLLFDGAPESQMEFNPHAYAVLGTLGPSHHFSLFVPTTKHLTGVSWETHLRRAVLDLPQQEVQHWILNRVAETSAIRTLAALTVWTDPIGNERVVLHTHQRLGMKDGAAYLRDALIQYGDAVPKGGVQ